MVFHSIAATAAPFSMVFTLTSHPAAVLQPAARETSHNHNAIQVSSSIYVSFKIAVLREGVYFVGAVRYFSMEQFPLIRNPSKTPSAQDKKHECASQESAHMLTDAVALTANASVPYA